MRRSQVNPEKILGKRVSEREISKALRWDKLEEQKEETVVEVSV